MSRLAYELALKDRGEKEWPGAAHNPKILKMFVASGHAWVSNDETPWCAAFVGEKLAESGMIGTGTLVARSYLKWGESVDITEAQKGDIVVLWREKKNSWKGHVGFFAGSDARGNVKILGGNQNNQVSIKTYPKERVLSIRRARRKITQSQTIRASTLGGLSVAGTLISAIASMHSTAQFAVIAFSGLALVAFFWIARERVKKWVVAA